MNDMMRWLLGLKEVSLGAEDLALGFSRPLPGWVWLCVVLLCVGYASWSYRRLEGARWPRVCLAGIRACVLLLIVAMVSGIELVERHEKVDKDWVVVLVDRSASMTVRDVGTAGARGSREAQLEAALEASWPMWREISAQKQVLWMGFDSDAFLLLEPTKAPADTATALAGGQAAGSVAAGSMSDVSGLEALDLGAPDGRRTRLGAALRRALRETAGRDLSGVVILSDGRSADEVDRNVLRRLTDASVPVFAVPLGSQVPVSDLAVRRVQSPDAVYTEDFAPVTVQIERTGVGVVQAEVQIIDKETGEILAVEPIDGDTFTEGGSSATVTVTVTPEDPGEREWIVRVVSGSGADLIPDNNEEEVSLRVVDTPVRVLYIDGSPRWEQRYLSSLLLRENTIVSSAIKLARGRSFTQESNEEGLLDTIPTSVQDWSVFDVVVLGDLDPMNFTEKQLEGLRDHVSLNGCGLLWIAGVGYTPEAWAETPIGGLIPFSPPAGVRIGSVVQPLALEPTKAADRFGVMRLGWLAKEPWPAILSDVSTSWAHLRWAPRVLDSWVKPTAEVLAIGRPVPTKSIGSIGTDTTPVPLVISMRYGAGRSMYVGSDDFWRWRHGMGGWMHERYWIQLLRMLARDRVARSGVPADLSFSADYPLVGRPVRVSLELLDQVLVGQEYGAVDVLLKPVDETSAPPVGLTLRRDAGSGRSFGATWLPGAAGKWTAEVDDSAFDVSVPVTAQTTVTTPDDELRHPETDHGALARLVSDAGSGRVVPPSDLGSVAEELPNRQRVRNPQKHESIWDSPLALILLISLLGIEWVGRRLVNLL